MSVILAECKYVAIWLTFISQRLFSDVKQLLFCLNVCHCISHFIRLPVSAPTPD